MCSALSRVPPCQSRGHCLEAAATASSRNFLGHLIQGLCLPCTHLWDPREPGPVPCRPRTGGQRQCQEGDQPECRAAVGTKGSPPSEASACPCFRQTRRGCSSEPHPRLQSKRTQQQKSSGGAHPTDASLTLGLWWLQQAPQCPSWVPQEQGSAGRSYSPREFPVTLLGPELGAKKEEASGGMSCPLQVRLAL